jgi:hypothetical protein
MVCMCGNTFNWGTAEVVCGSVEPVVRPRVL